MILIDFDRTIFDSDRFYDTIRLSLSTHVSAKRWQKIYNEYQKQHIVMNIFSMIEQNGLIKSDDLVAFQHEIAKRVSDFIYDDALLLVTNLKAMYIPYTIFSFGENDFQMYKIINSKIPVTEVVVTKNPKYQHKILQQAELWIDDNPHEFSQSSSANITRILLSRKGSKYTKMPHTEDNWFTIESLDELTVDKDSNVRIIR